MHLEKNKKKISPAKKSCTTILCELMRLKSQQKFLECNQIKLNPENFIDYDDDLYTSPGTTNLIGSGDSDSTCRSTQFVFNTINEIECLRIELNQNLQVYRENAQREIHEMWDFVNSIKDDVFLPGRLCKISLSELRGRIIKMNSQFERLISKNSTKLTNLQNELNKIEKEIEILVEH